MLCHLFANNHKIVNIVLFPFRWRQSGKAIRWTAGALCLGATAIGAPAMASPIPDSAGVSAQPGPDAGDNWFDRLLALLDLLCFICGCEEAQSRGPLDMSSAIARLALTVAHGVPPLTGPEGQSALHAAMDASVLAEQHALALGVDYPTLRLTLDTLIAALARENPR